MTMPPRKRKAPSGSSKYEEEYMTYSEDELRRKLQELGDSPGPINAANKDMYVRLLVKKKLKLDSGEPVTSSPGLSPTISSTSEPQGSPAELSRPPLRTAPQFPGVLAGTPSRGGLPAPRKGTPKSPPALSAKSHSAKKARVLSEVSKFTVSGLIAATFTPFTTAGEVNTAVIGQYADWLCQSGVSSVFVNGTTGESLSLTVAERKLLLDHWLEKSGGRLTVIAHVGCESIKDTCELAQHAEMRGAAAIGVMPTTFFKPSSIDHLIQYLSAVSQSAPNLPVFYYHIPSMTGVNFNMEDFLDVACSRLPALRGLKFTSTDLLQLSRCLTHSNGRFNIMYGVDQQLLGALVLGCTAAVGSTYNYMGKLNNRLWGAFRRNDIETARLEQRRSQAAIRLVEKYGGHAGVGKELMRLRGIDLGPPRLPIFPMTTEQLKTLEAGLRDIGFFEWA